MVVYTLEQRLEILRHYFLRFWQNIIFSYEAHFALDGYVNKQICRIWCIENPHAYIEKSTHPKRVCVILWILIQRHNWVIFLRK